MASDRANNRGAQRPYKRMVRVNSLLKRVLAEEIERLSDQDERIRLVTVTEVVCDPDLRHAMVYLGSISEDISTALEEHRRGLQSRVGTQLTMKRIPALKFVADPSIEAGARIEEILHRIGPSASDADE